MGDTFDDIFDDVGGFVGIDDSVKEGGIDIDADVVFGIDDLVAHIDDSGFHIDHSDVLSDRIVVV